MARFIGLSGLPRSGSTLLSALLAQNPAVHAEGNSAVCQLMWDLRQSCLGPAREQLKANRRETTGDELIAQIPWAYYRLDKYRLDKYIVDKCRAWTLPENVAMFRKYIDPAPKIIVLERPLIEILKSFQKIFRANHLSTEKSEELLLRLLEPDTDPLMRSWAGLRWAKANNAQNTFLFLTYHELVNQPEATMAKIYQFFGPYAMTYAHDYQTVLNKYPEDDEVYGLRGLHTVRSVVGLEMNLEVLSAEVLRKIYLVQDIYVKHHYTDL
jgi:sulfotransferase